jgi:hypothetical protein
VGLLDTVTANHEGEIHAFLLWSNARFRGDDILRDIRSRFDVVDVVEVEWSRELFAQNLTRFYGQTLPSGSEKEVHCGTGPMLLVVVRDHRPTYGLRRTTRGRATVNVRMYDARKRYRRWTGGGHRVHATLNRREADKDLFLLTGRRSSFYGRAAVDCGGELPAAAKDLVGADGWKSTDELLTALALVTGFVAVRQSTPAAAEPDRAPRLRLAVGNLWWAARVANGSGEVDREQEVRIAGDAVPIVLTEVDDVVWQQALLERGVRRGDGVAVPAPLDGFYLAVSEVVANGGEPPPSARSELDHFARELALPPLDFADTASLAVALDLFLTQLHAERGTDPRAERKRRFTPLAGLMRRAAGSVRS